MDKVAAMTCRGCNYQCPRIVPTSTKEMDWTRKMFEPGEVKSGLCFVCLSRTYESHNLTHRINATQAALRADEVMSRWLENLSRQANERRKGSSLLTPFDVAPTFRADDGSIDEAAVWEFLRLIRSPFTDTPDFGGTIAAVKTKEDACA